MKAEKTKLSEADLKKAQDEFPADLEYRDDATFWNFPRVNIQVQRCIVNPLLYDGKKTMIVARIMTAGHVGMFLHKDIRVWTCEKPYDSERISTDKKVFHHGMAEHTKQQPNSYPLDVLNAAGESADSQPTPRIDYEKVEAVVKKLAPVFQPTRKTTHHRILFYSFEITLIPDTDGNLWLIDIRPVNWTAINKMVGLFDEYYNFAKDMCSLTLFAKLSDQLALITKF